MYTLNKAKLLLLRLIHLFASEVLLVKQLEIEETKTTQYSTFKTDVIKMGLVFSIFNFFITKPSLANEWIRKKIPACSNSTLVIEGMKYECFLILQKLGRNLYSLQYHSSGSFGKCDTFLKISSARYLSHQNSSESPQRWSKL